MPIISIIVPIYNVENYLSHCLESIQNQTFKDFECLMIDDGSTDNSYEICKRFAQSDSRFIAIHQDNQGVSAARNAGISMARGSYISFIDGDDYIHPQMIQILYHYLSKEPACNFSMINFQTTYDIPPANYDLIQLENLHTRFISRDELFSGLFGSTAPINILLFYAVHCKLYRRETIGNTLFRDFVLSQDSEYNSRLYLKCKKAIYIDAPLYFYVQRDSSAIHQKYNINQCNRIKVYHACWHNIPNDMTIIKSQALERLYKFMVNTRYNIRNTNNNLKSYTNQLIKKIRKETLNILRKDSNLPPLVKYSLIMFTYSPFTYFLFIQFNEYKAKFFCSK